MKIICVPCCPVSVLQIVKCEAIFRNRIHMQVEKSNLLFVKWFSDRFSQQDLQNEIWLCIYI